MSPAATISQTCRIRMETDDDFEKGNKLMSQAVGRVKASEAKDCDEVAPATAAATPPPPQQ